MKTIHYVLFQSLPLIKTLISYFFLFAFGLAFGFTLSSYLAPASSSLQLFDHFTPTVVPSPLGPNLEQIVPTVIQSPPPPPEPEPSARVGLKEYLKPRENVMHDMTDEELLWRASMKPKIREYPFNRTPKIAFMFLVKSEIPLAPLWELFFRGHEKLYSVYVHGQSSYDESEVKASLFHGRRIPSKKVEWGKFNMVEAERRLLANALLDVSNQRFVLVSESCIPLFNFSTVYSYLLRSSTSFVDSYDLPGPVGRGRYRRRMRPLITLSDWRKGSQWFELDRELALEVVSDRIYFALFQRHCRSSCYPDEHYLPTFITKKFPGRNSNRSLTWTDWSHGGAHPARYLRTSVTPQTLAQMRTGISVNKTKECMHNGKPTEVCHLFARKFSVNALDRLLRFAPRVLGFG